MLYRLYEEDFIDELHLADDLLSQPRPQLLLKTTFEQQFDVLEYLADNEYQITQGTNEKNRDKACADCLTSLQCSLYLAEEKHQACQDVENNLICNVLL